MAFTQEELKQWEPKIATFVEDERPPEKVRSQVDLDYSIDTDDQSIEIFEIRSSPFKNGKTKLPIAKTKWIRSQRVWKVYWQRADLKWHKYDSLPEVKTLEKFIEEIKEDPQACFWG